MTTACLGLLLIPVWRLRYDPLNFVGRCRSHIGKHQSTKRAGLRRPLVRGDLEERWRRALGLHVSLNRRMPAECDRKQWQSQLLQSEPVLCSQPHRTQELAACLTDEFKNQCKI